MRLKKVLSTLSLTALLSSGGLLVTAVPAYAAPCGFSPVTTGNLGGGDDGNYEKGIYNHCSNDGTNTKIKVDYAYASQELCVTPGETELFANPNLGALRYAASIGRC